MIPWVQQVMKQAQARVLGGNTRADNKILSMFEPVFDQRPSDSNLLTPSIEKHKELLGRAPDLVAADAGFFAAANEAANEQLGVKASRCSQPFHQKRKAEEGAEEAPVQEGTEVADRCEGSAKDGVTAAFAFETIVVSGNGPGSFAPW